MAIRKFLHHVPKVDETSYVDEMALVLGQVTIGKDSSIWPMTAVRGDVHRIEIGARTNIQDGSILHVTADNDFNPGGYPLIIGDEVTVGHGVVLHACTVGNRCLVGMGATVLDGARMQDGSMVAAGSLVPPGKVVETGYLWMGSPVRKVRPLTDKEMAYLEYSAQHYVNLKNEHLSGMG
ncbi:MAG: gamma carbonic anhydrase family protein [Gammaproteobacteria bacterium]|nr:gamma carbonic anhydrase family protein [Gammaproteobacteria bacterium]MDH5693837.1 gamma carbonic anhydrase family protein [Gammaproteobacteria bacterium]